MSDNRIAEQRARQSIQRARQRARRQDVYHFLNGLFNLDLLEFAAFLRLTLKWLALGILVGILAGTASAIFLISLTWATEVRLENPWLLYLLPVGGFLIGWVYWRFGGSASRGNNLVIDEVNNNRSHIPLRMAPLVLVGTVVTHFFGGSAGREGTAIQMGASLADSLRRVLRLNPTDRRLIIMAGISGGFGSVFGVPAAGFVFGMEVQNVGRIRYEGIVPCLVASLVGDFVTRTWGAHHTHYPLMAEMPVDPLLMLKVALAGIAFGLTSMLFIELTHGIKHLLGHISKWPPLYPVIGGVTIIVLTWLVGTGDYLGLSLPLLSSSVDGTGVVAYAFLLKLIFTAVTLGTGFYGGEVTPLLVIGATLGYTLGRLLGVDPAFMASIGLVAVFAGASNTPLASAIMGIELVGGGAPLYIFLGCAVAYLASGHRGIYTTQQIGIPKLANIDFREGDNLQSLAERRGGWLPNLRGEPARRLVRSVMSQRVVSVREDAPLLELIRQALEEGVRAVPVLDSRKAVTGIVTDNDLRRAGLDINLTLLKQMTEDERAGALRAAEGKQVREIMTSPAVTISQLAPLSQAVELLNTQQLKRLPVVDDAGHLFGMITRSDILRELVFTEPSSDDTVLNWGAVVEDVDLEPALTVRVTAPLAEVVELLRPEAYKRLIVVNSSGQAAGIITESDLMTRASNGDRAWILDALRGQTSPVPPGGRVQLAADLMTTPILTVQADTPAYLALRYMLENQVKRLPVVDANQQPLGMVGRAGLMRVFFRGSSGG